VSSTSSPSAPVRCSSPPSRYRQHEEVVGPFPTHLQRRMAEEWVALNRDPSTGLLLARWAVRYPVLARADRPGRLVDAVDAGGHEIKDAILGALVELFQDRRYLAGRITLQAMLPKLAGFAFRDSVTGHVGGSPDDRFQTVIGEFWQVLGQYPTQRRPARVAANLALDTLARLKAAAGVPEIPLPPAELGQMCGVTGAATCGGPESGGDGIDVDVTLDDLLDWAVRRGVLGRSDAELLAEVYTAQPGPPGTYRDVAQAYRTLAEQTGTPAATLRQRAHRAKSRLTAAAQQALAAG